VGTLWFGARIKKKSHRGSEARRMHRGVKRKGLLWGTLWFGARIKKKNHTEAQRRGECTERKAKSGKLKADLTELYGAVGGTSMYLTLKGSHVYSPGFQPRGCKRRSLTCRARVIHECAITRHVMHGPDLCIDPPGVGQAPNDVKKPPALATRPALAIVAKPKWHARGLLKQKARPERTTTRRRCEVDEGNATLLASGKKNHTEAQRLGECTELYALRFMLSAFRFQLSALYL
jgi:hypothetical protein